jgi:hypothetical protein
MKRVLLSALWPTLFLIYINDIPDDVTSTIRFFADDCVIYRPVGTSEDHILLHKDIDTLVQWSETWQMEFNVKKGTIMQFTSSKKKNSFHYTIKGESLEIVHHKVQSPVGHLMLLVLCSFLYKGHVLES